MKQIDSHLAEGNELSAMQNVTVIRTPKTDLRHDTRSGTNRIDAIRREVQAGTESIGRHRYFELCRSREIGRAQLMEIIGQLYCFSVFFERLLTLRIAYYSSN